MVWKVVDARRFIHQGRILKRFELRSGKREVIVTCKDNICMIMTSWGGQPSDYTLERIFEAIRKYEEEHGW